VFETEPPVLPELLARPAILVFSKTNGYRHEEAIPAANKLLASMAVREGWSLYQTENGAVFNPTQLGQFDAVVFNNVSGNVFTPEQREALESFIENGGGFVGIHGSGGDPSYKWQWYVESLIGAQFIGHPMGPQFQQATMYVEDKTHPATQTLPDAWVRTDEWYSFEQSARKDGVQVLATLDETSYSPVGMGGQDLTMGTDHPIVWSHCQGRGRALYSALGHQAAAYAEPLYQDLLKGAIAWAARLQGTGCEMQVDDSSASQIPAKIAEDGL
jgi:type 1 glutamine amidotransferase